VVRKAAGRDLASGDERKPGVRRDEIREADRQNECFGRQDKQDEGLAHEAGEYFSEASRAGVASRFESYWRPHLN
jgi:hypothetical protein